MSLPRGIKEKDFLEAVNNAGQLLSFQFKFGPYEQEDIKQEIALEVLQFLHSGKYDKKRPLINIAYTVAYTRLLNKKRNLFRRSDTPCDICNNSIPGYTAHIDKQYCAKYLKWLKLNGAKQSLMCPNELSPGPDEPGSDTDMVSENVETKELLEKIDKELPLEYRADYLKMRAGQKISKVIRNRVEEIIKEILKDSINA